MQQSCLYFQCILHDQPNFYGELMNVRDDLINFVFEPIFLSKSHCPEDDVHRHYLELLDEIVC